MKMPSFGIQFHAAPDELARIVDHWLRGHDWSGAAMWTQPRFHIQVIRSEHGLAALMVELGTPRFVCLSLGRLNPHVASEPEFHKKNPDCLLIDFGRHDPGGLGESFVGAKTDNESAMKVWRTIGAWMRRHSSAGAWAVNVQSGARAYIKSHRYMPGAAKLAQQGCGMWALGNANYYVFWPGVDAEP